MRFIGCIARDSDSVILGQSPEITTCKNYSDNSDTSSSDPHVQKYSEQHNCGTHVAFPTLGYWHMATDNGAQWSRASASSHEHLELNGSYLKELH